MIQEPWKNKFAMDFLKYPNQLRFVEKDPAGWAELWLQKIWAQSRQKLKEVVDCMWCTFQQVFYISIISTKTEMALKVVQKPKEVIHIVMRKGFDP